MRVVQLEEEGFYWYSSVCISDKLADLRSIA